MPPNGFSIELVDGKLLSSSGKELDAVFQQWRSDSHRDHLVVHFHGGLVSRRAGLQSAEEVLLPAYRAAMTYPMFFIWNSDIQTTLTSDLLAIAQEPSFQRLLRRLARFAVKALFSSIADGDKGTEKFDLPPAGEPEELERRLKEIEREQPLKPEASLRLSDALVAEIQLELQQDTDLQGDLRLLMQVDSLTLPSHRMVERIQEESGSQSEEGDKAAVTWLGLAVVGTQVIAAVVDRYRHGRHHGVYDTLMQEMLRKLAVDDVGQTVWSRIKAQTSLAFGNDADHDGGAAFVKRLAADWNSAQRVTLVGHSTGAIFIGNFLQHADRCLPANVQFDVVLLAPACTFAFFHERLELFRRRIRKLRLFGLLDAREKSYWEVPILSRGSLLYIVSGLFEGEADTPLLGMQRYFSQNWPYDAMPVVSEVLEYVKPKDRVWAITDTTESGRQSSALTHGGIMHDAKTLASIQHFLMEE